MSIYDFLAKHAIPYQRFDHEAVFTCEESEKLPPMPGAPTKNLFLRDSKGKRYFLVVVGHEKAVDLKALKKMIGADKLSFGSPEKLKELLGVDPGSATVLGLITDKNHAIEVIFDQSIWNADSIQCHPMINTGTLVISHADLVKFLESTGHTSKAVYIPARITE